MKLKITMLLLLFAGGITESFAQSGFRYPYVIKGNPGVTRDVIVSRDENGGVREDYVRDTKKVQWDTTPEHNQYDDDNIVASRFEVSKIGAVKQPYQSAATYCKNLKEDDKDGWRVPTQRELMLIYVLNDQLANPLITSKQDEIEHGVQPSADGIFYWSGTKDTTNGEDNVYWSVCFSDRSDEGMETKGGQVQGYADNANQNYIRCVRDVVE